MSFIKVAFPFYKRINSKTEMGKKIRKTANKRPNKTGTRKQKRVKGGINMNLSVTLKNVSIPLGENISRFTKPEYVVLKIRENLKKTNKISEEDLEKRNLYVKLTTEPININTDEVLSSVSSIPQSSSPLVPAIPASKMNYIPNKFDGEEMKKIVGAAVASLLSNKQNGGANPESVYHYICGLNIQDAVIKPTIFDKDIEVSNFETNCETYKNQYIRLDNNMNIDFTILNTLKPEYAFLETNNVSSK
jgi:hypothetical protein